MTRLAASTCAALATLGALSTLAPEPARAQVQREIEIRGAPMLRIAGGPEEENRAAIGVSTTATGTLRDTLGLLVTMVTDGGPAQRAGLEEGNRIQAVNGVSLRANAADVEDMSASGALARRLVRELGKVKPGEEVELRVYREGRSQTMRVKTAASDSLFSRRRVVRVSREEADDRPALGFATQTTGSRRDTLGVFIASVGDSTPAERAGLEEGMRVAAINGVNLRVAREDAGDPAVGMTMVQRLHREIAKLKPGTDATLRVYANGQFRDVRVRVARAADLPRRNRMFFGGMMGPMPPMPPMPAMPVTPGVPPVAPRAWPMESLHLEIGPAIEQGLREAGVELERVRPQLERLLRDLPATLQNVRVPTVTVDVKGGGIG